MLTACSTDQGFTVYTYCSKFDHNSISENRLQLSIKEKNYIKNKMGKS